MFAIYHCGGAFHGRWDFSFSEKNLSLFSEEVEGALKASYNFHARNIIVHLANERFIRFGNSVRINGRTIFALPLELKPAYVVFM